MVAVLLIYQPPFQSFFKFSTKSDIQSLYTKLRKQSLRKRITLRKCSYATAQKMKFSIKNFFNKCDHFRSFQRIWTHHWRNPSWKTSFFVQCVLKEFDDRRILYFCQQQEAMIQPKLTIFWQFMCYKWSATSLEDSRHG